MPASYAHYRFGRLLLPGLPDEIRQCVQRFRRMYDAGLHGPDIFYFQTGLVRTGTFFMGVKYHEYTGKELFPRACRTARLERSEAAQAYARRAEKADPEDGHTIRRRRRRRLLGAAE